MFYLMIFLLGFILSVLTNVLLTISVYSFLVCIGLAFVVYYYCLINWKLIVYSGRSFGIHATNPVSPTYLLFLWIDLLWNYWLLKIDVYGIYTGIITICSHLKNWYFGDVAVTMVTGYCWLVNLGWCNKF